MKGTVGSLFQQVEGLNMEKFHRGRVVANNDPLKEGRLQIYIPALLTEEDKYTEKVVDRKTVLSVDIFENSEELTYSSEITESNAMWFRPCAAFYEKDTTGKANSGSYKVPKVNTMLLVYFENGDSNKPYWMPFSPSIDGEVIEGVNLGKALGGKLSKENWGSVDNKPNINVMIEEKDSFIIYYDSSSKHFAIFFPTGHQITINSNSEENGIDLRTAGGHIASLSDKNKNILLKSAAGYLMQLDDGAGNAKISTPGGSSTITLTNGIISQKASRINLN